MTCHYASISALTLHLACEDCGL